MNNSNRIRSPLTVTLATWHALFLREAVARLSTGRAAWMWLFFEPVIHVVFLLYMFTVIHIRTVAGIDTAVSLIIGLVFIFMFKRTSTQAQNAISANLALYTYRQVKPIDTVIVRALLEGFLSLLIGLLLAIGANFFGIKFIPIEPILLMGSFINLWLLALGLGLIGAIGILLIPELEKIIRLTQTPIYLTSGAIIPISTIPEPYQHWLLFNPIVHSMESARKSMSIYYHTSPEINFFYPAAFSLVSLFLGLLLHIRFVSKVYKS